MDHRLLGNARHHPRGLDSSIVNVSLPHMQGSFSASVDEIAWVVTSYLVAAGIMIPMTGWIAGASGASATSWPRSRCSWRIGAMRGRPVAQPDRVFPPAAGSGRRRHDADIASGADGNLSAARTDDGDGGMGHRHDGRAHHGPHIGGYITDAWSWRWNFYINVPIGGLGIFMAYRFLEDPPYMRVLRKGGRIDWVGILCLVIALGVGEIVAGAWRARRLVPGATGSATALSSRSRPWACSSTMNSASLIRLSI